MKPMTKWSAAFSSAPKNWPIKRYWAAWRAHLRYLAPGFLTKQAPIWSRGSSSAWPSASRGSPKCCTNTGWWKTNEEYREPNHPARMLGAAVALGLFSCLWASC